MSITFKYGDIFDSNLNTIICHQVNCKGKMGSGIAKQIREKCPNAYNVYMNQINVNKILGLQSFYNLGNMQLVANHDGRIVANLFAQDGYGYDGKLYTDYKALKICLDELNRIPGNVCIAIPYNIGCGLGGGDWNIVIDMIEKSITNHDVEIWKLKKDE